MTAASSHEALSVLLDHVEKALEAQDRKPIETSRVQAGTLAWDDCCGSLIVAPERVWRYKSFPAEAVGDDDCWAGFLALSVNVILLRCLPVVQDDGSPPDADELDAAYADFMGDADAILNIVGGPMPDEEWRVAGVGQTFTGDLGGCVAVETRFLLGLEQDAWCAP